MAQNSSGKAAMRLEDLVVPAKNGEHRSIPGAKFIMHITLLVLTMLSYTVTRAFGAPFVWVLSPSWAETTLLIEQYARRAELVVPPVVLQEKVETFVGSCNPTSVEYLFKELLQKYRFMEHSLLGQKDTLRAKTLAIKETMDALEMLKRQRVREPSCYL
ncbi:hypothetical protein EMWEY_00034460 [Eimeria maxima]|uniref:Uncharacterized protein n=1 Tax=Eimeria maxima TaxID=5804 RepID=U6ME72_EIMMA|nr:hypothetical protein EMWEY_00034460 [Eimeria maxima]CDJ60749.1 hypothetical protein EMWEY_00034460 [Eimeria maxima]